MISRSPNEFQPLFYTITAEESAARLSSSPEHGLTDTEAAERQKVYGLNELTEKKHPSFFIKFLSQFKDFMIIVLLAAATVSLITSSLGGSPDYAEPLIILAIVVLNAIIGVAQESKAERTLESLRQLASPHALVVRGGVQCELDAAMLVPGDIIVLDSGRSVPADARLLSSYSLTADESSLTGESHPVEKNHRAVLPESTSLADRTNMVFASTSIASGHGRAIITRTGMNTEVGHIASLIADTAIPETPLQLRLAKAGRFLAVGALFICIIMFIVGILQGRLPYEMFMTSVSLAVSAIPEGLPCIVTIMLSLGVQRMVKKNAIVRKLPAVETLGSATYICSDKTGTLTQNKMSVEAYADLRGVHSHPGSECAASETPLFDLDTFPLMLSLGTLCGSDTADTMELAIADALKDCGLAKSKLVKNFPKILEVPFDSARKYMTTVHSCNGSELVVTKGAVDVILKKCSHVYDNGKSLPMGSLQRSKITQHQLSMSFDSLRVIGVAYSLCPRGSNKGTPKDNELIFLGLLGIIDPPRPGIRDTILSCRLAGITPVMITGDHIGTACAIASRIGIIEAGHITPSTDLSQFAVSGNELENMTQDELEERVHKIRVYARVSPSHKVRIVKALQKSGEVVAMTGDGVNDAPALKASDIGCAMGITGTDVAKNASDMILTDDNFATIVAAIREGRGIYSNIRKAVHFLLSCNIGEIITIFTAIIFGLPSPLLPIQLLWVNLITDSLPAIALGVEPVTDSIMRQPPTKKNSGIFSKGLTIRIALEGSLIGILSLTAYILGGSTYGQTYAFAVLSLSQLFHAFNVRSEYSLRRIGLFSNPRLVGAFVLGAALQAAVLASAPAAAVFGVVCPPLSGWLTILALSAVPILIIELQKHITHKS